MGVCVCVYIYCMSSKLKMPNKNTYNVADTPNN